VATGVIVEALGPARAVALAALFDREGSPCFCRYWHFGGTNKEWEARCAERKDDNRAELSAAIAAGTEEARGLVALRGEDVVGWMKLTRRAALPKLLARFPYRGLDDPRDVFAIGCFLVDPSHRRAGVATALLDFAIAHAPTWGARFLEAYPRASDAPLHEGELFQGPHALFASRGFAVVREAPQYPVLRRAL